MTSGFRPALRPLPLETDEEPTRVQRTPVTPAASSSEIVLAHVLQVIAEVRAVRRRQTWEALALAVVVIAFVGWVIGSRP